MYLNVGVPEPDAGPAKNSCCACEASVAVRVPVVVTGELLTVKIEGRDSPTEVTVPEPADIVVQVGLVPVPPEVSTCPLVPAAALRVSPPTMFTEDKCLGIG
jgi:hypothetical protein